MTSSAAANPITAAQRIEELGRIILAYSEVTEKLQQAHERLQQTVQSLRDELSEKNRLLERKNRLAALGEMAAGMAHEIRNPLGGIQLYASMLARDVADRPPSAELVGKISGGVKRLEWLVSQVLQFTRDITANIDSCDLAGIVSQALELAEPQIQAKKISVVIKGPSSFPVNIDGNLFTQALLNLTLNGIDSMRTGGRLLVGYLPAAETDGARQFSLIVRDTGPGIPPTILDRIFNPFFTTKDSGTGLGLAIVHRIVEAHDGSITVTNPDDGGARFEIRI